MRIAIIGAGGVGGYFGARLATAGEDVTFIARGAHLAAMREAGLRVRSPLGDCTVRPVQAESDPGDVGIADLVIVAVKLWDTEAAMRAAEPLLGPASALLSLQNGVEAAAIASRCFGRERVLGGVAHIAAVIEAPGVIRTTGTLARLTFGELDGRVSVRTETLLAACTRAGIDAAIAPEVERAIWEKFIFIAGLSGMSALTRMPAGPIRSDPVTRAVLRDVMAEAAAVARAKGIAVAPDIADVTLRFIDTLAPEMISSMLGDLRRGQRLEVEWLAGAVVRLGAEVGVEAPLNRAIYAALKLHAGGAPAAAGG